MAAATTMPRRRPTKQIRNGFLRHVSPPGVGIRNQHVRFIAKHKLLLFHRPTNLIFTMRKCKKRHHQDVLFLHRIIMKTKKKPSDELGHEEINGKHLKGWVAQQTTTFSTKPGDLNIKKRKQPRTFYNKAALCPKKPICRRDDCCA